MMGKQLRKTIYIYIYILPTSENITQTETYNPTETYGIILQ